MGFDPELYHRRSVRLRGYDYATPGAYFITICTFGRACLFADPCDDGVVLNGAGRIAEVAWRDLPAHFPNIELDAFVVMPNHVHGIVMLTERTPRPDGTARIDRSIEDEPTPNGGAQHAVPLPDESLRIDRSIDGEPITGVWARRAVPLPGESARIDRSMDGEPDTGAWAQHAVPLPGIHERVDRSIDGEPIPNVGAQHAVPLPGEHERIDRSIDGEPDTSAWAQRAVPLPGEHERIDRSIDGEPDTGAWAQRAVPLPGEHERIDRSIDGEPDTGAWAQHAVPLPDEHGRIVRFSRPSPGSIPTIVRSYKAAVTAEINNLRAVSSVPIWQRGFHEHIIRDEDSLNRIREYIALNPANWLNDRDHPRFLKPSP